MTTMEEQAALDVHAYRRTMGLFATGVAIMTTTDEDGDPLGMTANAISSVSLTPTLLLVCVKKEAQIMQHLKHAPGFALSFLEAAQQPLSDYFAGIWDDERPAPPFEFMDWVPGGPRLVDCIAAVGCQHWAMYDGGDHWIVVGEVTALYRPENPPEPLIFFNGLYRQLEGMKDEIK